MAPPGLDLGRRRGVDLDRVQLGIGQQVGDGAQVVTDVGPELDRRGQTLRLRQDLAEQRTVVVEQGAVTLR